MLKTVDLFSSLAKTGPEEMADWLKSNQTLIEETTVDLRRMAGDTAQLPVMPTTPDEDLSDVAAKAFKIAPKSQFHAPTR